jgi:CRP/FNR family cyclic AMP-dependent transcriptional regulator
MAPASKVVDLSSVWLFSECSKAELKTIERAAEPQAVPTGKSMCHEGEVGTVFYFILSGKAAVIRHGGKVAELGPGQYFGELSLLDRLPRNATVKSLTDMTVLAIGQRDFENLLKESPSTTRKLLIATAARLRSADFKALAAIIH